MRGPDPDGSPITAPGPTLGLVAEARTDRVQREISTCLKEMPVSLDQLGVVPAAEHVPLRPMAVVEGASVVTIEFLHPCGEIGLRGRDEQVVMRAQDAVRRACPEVLTDDRGHDGHERFAIMPVEEDRPPRGTPRRHVVARTRGLNSCRPRHSAECTARSMEAARAAPKKFSRRCVLFTGSDPVKTLLRGAGTGRNGYEVEIRRSS